MGESLRGYENKNRLYFKHYYRFIDIIICAQPFNFNYSVSNIIIRYPVGKIRQYVFDYDLIFQGISCQLSDATGCHRSIPKSDNQQCRSKIQCTISLALLDTDGRNDWSIGLQSITDKISR